MNKKQYVTPEMEITEFDTEDVITTSGGQPNGQPNEKNEMEPIQI